MARDDRSSAPRPAELQPTLRIEISGPATVRGAPAADGFRSALQSLQQWTVHHPCPDPAFAGRFQVLLARYGFISLVTEDEASLDDGASSSAAVRRLRVLNVDLRDFLDDLEEHQREQRCGEPLD